MKFPAFQGTVIQAVSATSFVWIIATFVASWWLSQGLPWSTSGQVATFPPVCGPYAGQNNISAESIQYKMQPFETESELLRHAFHTALGPLPPGPPVIAFLFLVRGEVPFEPVWQQFFKGHEKLHSIYVHAQPGFKYPHGSIFEGKEIPSKEVQRMSVSLLDAIRRLLSYALADPRYNNAWFVNVCEATIPIRGFPFVYQYLMGSNQSFVQQYVPDGIWTEWETMPEFPKPDLRKGETWMQFNRKHAIIVVADRVIYPRFVAACISWCVPDEEYFQTLLHLEDCGGSSHRTLMYTDWSDPNHGSSPRKFGPENVNVELLKRIQEMRQEPETLLRPVCGSTNQERLSASCRYNGVPNSICYLFARKFDPAATSAILNVSLKLLEH